ncbi:PREDICTED: uncharacterized protein LOC106344684 [Brassica oleracea var. oleracea]|uniref:uncharacterized protein LOC106344684 n=1 Tax=Brassica oleracea var. oleracea TaxID=109376 RepID=UPI0006A73D0E|nr:PREDICTED: uncharacterized protein LOC106344684 [Brassica oleracea var. oleracea]
MWVAHLNRLPTRSRIARWSPQASPLCCLCNSFEKTRDHLLISYDYSSAIWSPVLARLGYYHNILSWAEFMSWIRVSSSRCPSTLRQLVAQATVYHLWKQQQRPPQHHLYLSPFRVQAHRQGDPQRHLS